MVGDAQATKQRLLDAAAQEFAAYGIAGGRVDRIAAGAQSNKAQIYHYFGSKDGLFDAVLHEMVVNVLREVPLDPDDLPGYAGRLFDGYEAHPEVQRLANWYRLERAESDEPIEIIVKGNRDKIAAIAKAQKAGKLTKKYSATDLLALVLHLSGLWAALTPEYVTLVSRSSRAHRRRVVTDAVAALIAH
jgi:AcrR family transcriptional regulator